MKSCFLILLIFVVFRANAQELIIYNATQNNITTSSKNSKSIIELPFFDDFSYKASNPDTALWSDNYVTINANLAKPGPSIGVATFDAVNASGKFYNHLDYNKKTHADTLTSKPVNLNFPADTTIYLSFFFQPQGYADKPEAEDSLLLDFFSPLTGQWENIWAMPGFADNIFKQVIIPIRETRFLQNGFQFRFRNKISLGSSIIPSIVGNCDFWHIDYVYLNKNRNYKDTIYRDLAFQTIPDFRFGNYQNMPYQHYLIKLTEGFSPSLQLNYRNNDSRIRLVESLNLVINSQTINTKIELGSYNLTGFQEENYFNSTLNYTLIAQSPTSASIQVTAEIVTDTYDLNTNNSVTTQKTYSDFYAYDDGTAEAGYGIAGEGTQQAMLACKFFTYKQDYLTGFYIYFNETFKNAQSDFIRLMVWNQNPETGLPGEVVYKKDGVQIKKDSLNQFCFYPTDSLFTVSDTFFIGWQKTSVDIAHVGIDLNTENINVKYYNINGAWIKSQFPGQLLLRPVMNAGKATNLLPVKTVIANLYPNPAKNLVYLQIPDYDFTTYQLEIFDINGHKISETTISGPQTTINISGFPDGIYFIRTKQNEINGKFIKISN